MVQDLEHGACGASFGIGSAVNQAGDASVDKRSGAHGAGFNGGVDSTAGVAQTMVAQVCGGLAQRDDLSVGGGIAIEQVAIVPTADNFTIFDY